MNTLKVDTTKKVRFTSDCGRHKYDDFYMTDIVFENENVCLCNSDIDELILFDKNTNKVLTVNVETGYYYAENYDEFEDNDYCKFCENDYDDPQMCRFCINGSHQTLIK